MLSDETAWNDHDLEPGVPDEPWGIDTPCGDCGAAPGEQCIGPCVDKWHAAVEAFHGEGPYAIGNQDI